MPSKVKKSVQKRKNIPKAEVSQDILSYRRHTNEKYRAYITEVNDMWKNREIVHPATALRIAQQLSGKGKAPQAGIASITRIKDTGSVAKTLDKAESAIEKMKNSKQPISDRQVDNLLREVVKLKRERTSMDLDGDDEEAQPIISKAKIKRTPSTNKRIKKEKFIL